MCWLPRLIEKDLASIVDRQVERKRQRQRDQATDRSFGPFLPRHDNALDADALSSKQDSSQVAMSASCDPRLMSASPQGVLAVRETVSWLRCRPVIQLGHGAGLATPNRAIQSATCPGESSWHIEWLPRASPVPYRNEPRRGMSSRSRDPRRPVHSRCGMLTRQIRRHLQLFATLRTFRALLLTIPSMLDNQTHVSRYISWESPLAGTRASEAKRLS